MRRFLTSPIEILVRKETDAVNQEQVREVVDLLIKTLENYGSRVGERLSELCSKANISLEEIQNISSRISVPWLLLETGNGGLGVREAVSEESWSMAPCRLYTSHGVFLDKRNPEGPSVSLVTARKEGKPWSQENDFLHEFLHASFAPIPAYVQSWHIQHDINSQRLEAGSLNELNESHVGWMTYAIPELVVGYLAGEKRDTETGLPVLETKEMLSNFLNLTSTLMPQFGFQNVKHRFDQEGLTSDVHLHLVAACMRTLEVYKTVMTVETPPLEFFKNLAPH